MVNTFVQKAVPTKATNEQLDRLEEDHRFKLFRRAMEQALYSQYGGAIDTVIYQIEGAYPGLIMPRTAKKAVNDEDLDELKERNEKLLASPTFLKQLKGIVIGAIGYSAMRLLSGDMFGYTLWASNEGGKYELMNIGVSERQAAVFMLADDDLLEILRLRVDMLVTGLTDTSRNILFADLVTGLKQGMTKEELSSFLVSRGTITSTYRANLIAQNELANAYGTIRQESALRNGAITKKLVTAGDQGVCSICESDELEGEIPIDQSFSDGSFAAPIHISCRCDVDYFYPFDPGEYTLNDLWFGE